MFEAFVLACTTEVFPNQEWWCEEEKAHNVFPNTCVFKGYMRDNFNCSYEWNDIGYATLYTDCQVDENNPIKIWLRDMKVTVLVVGIYNYDMYYMPFEETLYRNFSTTLDTYLPIIFDKMKVSNFCNKCGIAVAVSGGGCRTALLGMKVMKHIHTIAKTLHVAAGCSGGAWGITMYYLYRYDTRAFVDVLIDNNKQLKKSKPNTYILNVSKILEAGPFMETAAYMIPIIKHFKYEWENIIYTLIFGKIKSPSWRIFPDNILVVFQETWQKFLRTAI